MATIDDSEPEPDLTVVSQDMDYKELQAVDSRLSVALV